MVASFDFSGKVDLEFSATTRSPGPWRSGPARSGSGRSEGLVFGAALDQTSYLDPHAAKRKEAADASSRASTP